MTINRKITLGTHKNKSVDMNQVRDCRHKISEIIIYIAPLNGVRIIFSPSVHDENISTQPENALSIFFR